MTRRTILPLPPTLMALLYRGSAAAPGPAAPQDTRGGALLRATVLPLPQGVRS